MFLKLNTKYGIILVNSDDISYIGNMPNDTLDPVNDFYFMLQFKNSRTNAFYETEEIMNQEFDWIMSKLGVVQNVTETVHDNVAGRGCHRHGAWDFNTCLTIDQILIEIYNNVKNSDGENIVILVTKDEYDYIYYKINSKYWHGYKGICNRPL